MNEKLGELQTMMKAMAQFIMTTEEFTDWVWMGRNVELWQDTSQLKDRTRTDLEMVELFLKGTGKL